MLRLTNKTLAVCFGLIGGASALMAQAPSANVYFGLGTAMDSSSGQSLDLLGNGAFSTPKMTGLFADVGGSFMLTPHLGAAAEVNWRASQGNYAGVNYRPIFYDFNGVWQPLKSSRFVPEIQAGLGGVAVHFNANQQACDALVGCSNVNVGSESSDHFQAHFSLAARLYATPHLFLRPAVDVHWVNNFFQFGSDWVPEYSLGIGYTFGAGQ